MKPILVFIAVLAFAPCACRRADPVSGPNAPRKDDTPVTTPTGVEPGTGTGATIEPSAAHPIEPVLK
jgi:hypothetical protein